MPTGVMPDKSILDRVVSGDNDKKYTLIQLDDNTWRIQLEPDPDEGSVSEEGTPINHELLQDMYDRLQQLWNYFYETSSTGFAQYVTDRGVSVTGYINSDNGYVEV